MDRRFWIFLFLFTATESHDFLTLPTCGLSKGVPNGDRIVGGRDAVINEFPWQVSLQFKSLFISPTHLCGASILNEHWIITAAHCVYRRYARNFDVVAGINDLEERKFVKYSVDQIKVHELFDPETYLNDIAVDAIKVHELFDPETYLNDIAVVHVSRPISLSSGVNGICLPPVEQNVTGYATATGWGATREDGSSSSTLQTVEVPLISPNKCKDLFGPANYFPAEMLCAGDLDGGMDSCQGDSGGPFIQEQNGRSVLIGIISWGIGCARPNLPGVYTRVSHYIDWIVDHTL